MTAPFSVRGISDQLYTSLLAGQYRNSFRLFDQDIALANEADAQELICRDPAILATLDQFSHEVAATGIRVVAAGKDTWSARLASHFEELIGYSNISTAIYELTGAAFWGRAYAYPNGQRRFLSLGGGTPQSYWIPTHIQDIDHRRVIYVPVTTTDVTGRRHVTTKRQLGDPITGRYADMQPGFEENLIETKWGDTETRLGYGRGWINAIYFYWRAKTLAVQQGLQGLERWAQGLLYGTVDIERPGSDANTNQNLANDFLAKLKNMRSQNVAVIPQGSGEIKVAETSGSGHQIVSWFINYFDGQIARLILGAAMPTGAGESNGGAGSAGSEGKASVQAAATTRRILFHRKRLEECLNRSLMVTIYRANFPQFAAEGLAMAKMPRIRILDEEHTDPKSVIEIIKGAREAGMSIPKAWAHEVTRIPVPLDNEETLEPVSTPDPFAPMGMDFPGGGGGDSAGENSKDARQQGPSKFRSYDPPPLPIQPAPIIVQPAAQGPQHFHVTMPDLPDVAAAKMREGVLRDELNETRKSFEAAMDRPLVVNVAAPVVKVTNEAAKAPDVHVAPIINVAPSPAPNVSVNVEAAKPVDVHVEAIKSGDKILTVKRDKDGKIVGGTVRDEK